MTQFGEATIVTMTQLDKLATKLSNPSSSRPPTSPGAIYYFCECGITIPTGDYQCFRVVISIHKETNSIIVHTRTPMLGGG